MITKVELHTPQVIFDLLHGIADTKKKQIKIDAENLRQVLMDYSIMIDALQRSVNHRVIEPSVTIHRERPRLGIN
jgi:hypothetical protein